MAALFEDQKGGGNGLFFFFMFLFGLFLFFSFFFFAVFLWSRSNAAVISYYTVTLLSVLYRRLV